MAQANNDGSLITRLFYQSTHFIGAIWQVDMRERVAGFEPGVTRMASATAKANNRYDSRAYASQESRAAAFYIGFSHP
jgi:hypothetical protein